MFKPTYASRRTTPRSQFLAARLWPCWVLAALLSACGTPPADKAQPPVPTNSTAPAPSTTAPSKGIAPAPSEATTPRAYRQDAARHLYQRNQARIYSGKLPSMLYAVGVLEVHIDRQGQVTQLHWLRAPKHAPEVITEIEKTVRQAAPYPTPSRLGRVVYTDTWLWDESGRFQLDTLSEGQH